MNYTRLEQIQQRLSAHCESVMNLSSKLTSSSGRDLTGDEKQIIRIATLPDIKAAMHRATVSLMIDDSSDNAMEELMHTLHELLNGPVESKY